MAVSGCSTTLHCGHVPYSFWRALRLRWLLPMYTVQGSKQLSLLSTDPDPIMPLRASSTNSTSLLERLSTYSAPVVIVGDFNINVDDTTDTGAS